MKEKPKNENGRPKPSVLRKTKFAEGYCTCIGKYTLNDC